jgi:rsbT co-antagonist protein RsbR
MAAETGQVPLQLLSVLTHVATRLGTVRTLTEMAEAVTEVVEQVITVEYTGFYLVDPDDGKLRFVAARGFSPQERDEAERTAAERHPGWVVRSGRVLHVPDVEADLEQRTQDSAGRNFKVRSRLYLPVFSVDACVGAYGLASIRPQAFTETHMALLGYAASLTGATYGRLANERKLSQQLQILNQKQHELLLLSSPVIELAEQTLALPIIGTVDRERASHMAEQLLQRVVSQRAKQVILDFTGTGELPEGAVREILRIVSAVELLGCRCALSGVSPRLAKSVASSSLAQPEVRSYSSLKQALAMLAARPR